MRLSRPCYDKAHRCPGWAGGGWKSARRDRCPGGYVTTTTPDLLDPAEWPERDCTCGARIRATHPELGHATPWEDEGGSPWCPPKSEGQPWREGHRPPRDYAHPAADKWRFGRCSPSRSHANEDRHPGHGCGVVTWPWALRRLDPTWWWGFYGWRLRHWLDDRAGR